MKPSDRIHELAAKHATRLEDSIDVDYGTQELVLGLVEYLDECHENELRELAALAEWKKERGL